MKGVALSSFWIYVVSILQHQVVTAERPTMFPVGGLINLQEGDELIIECRGRGKIEFSTEKLTIEVEQSDFTISHDENSGTYKFIRPKTMGVDTGWYACAEEGVEIQNNEQTIEHPSEDISWTYVYVKSSQPFAVMDALYDFIPPAVAGGDAVIPCRPTSPELNVTLHTESSPGVVPEQPPFDPKIGFTLKNVQKRQSGENFRCEASGFDDDTCWPVYSMHVADPNPLQKPRIDQEAARHVVSGQNLSLHCSISVPQGTMFSLVWEPPASIPQERFVRKPMQKTKDRDIWEVELTVTNVEKGDAGEYICIAKHVFGDETRSSININVWDPDYKYINISARGANHQIFLNAKETVQWVFLIDTYPEKFELTWLTESGTEVTTNETDPRSRYSHSAVGTHHVFRISDLVFEDTGNYTIHVKTSDGESSIVLSLAVKGKPNKPRIVVEEKTQLVQRDVIYIGTICVLSAIIIVLIAYMGIRSRRQRVSGAGNSFSNIMTNRYKHHREPLIVKQTSVNE